MHIIVTFYTQGPDTRVRDISPPRKITDDKNRANILKRIFR